MNGTDWYAGGQCPPYGISYLTGMLVGNAHHTVYQGFRRFQNAYCSAIKINISRIDLYKIWVNDSFYNPVRAGGLGLCNSDLNRPSKKGITFLNRTAN